MSNLSEFGLSNTYLCSYGCFWCLLWAVLTPTLAKELFNVILGHFHTRAAQSCSGNCMHWQLAQQQTQIINWEAEMQVGNTVGTLYQMGGLNFRKVVFCFP